MCTCHFHGHICNVTDLLKEHVMPSENVFLRNKFSGRTEN